MTPIQIEAAKTALQVMFAGSHFSICTIDKILKMTRGVPNKDDYNILSTLHCVNWSDMTPELLRQLPALIQRVLSAPAIMWNHAMPLQVATIDLSIELQGKKPGYRIAN